MTKTGIKFDLNPKTFTVGNLFEMHLNSFKEQIDEITMAATQEARIEKVLGGLLRFLAVVLTPERHARNWARSYRIGALNPLQCHHIVMMMVMMV